MTFILQLKGLKDSRKDINKFSDLVGIVFVIH